MEQVPGKLIEVAKICAKIETAKDLWNEYKCLAEESNKKGLHFLQQHLHDIYQLYQSEINELRVDLCRERGE